MEEAGEAGERDGPWANLLSPETLTDPYAFLAALREEHGPVCWSAATGPGSSPASPR